MVPLARMSSPRAVSPSSEVHVTRRTTVRPWAPWLLVALGALGAIFGFMGYAMQASFSVADPPDAPSRDGIALFYLALMLLSVVVALAAGATVFIRSLRAEGGRPIDGTVASERHD